MYFKPSLLEQEPDFTFKKKKKQPQLQQVLQLTFSSPVSKVL